MAFRSRLGHDESCQVDPSRLKDGSLVCILTIGPSPWKGYILIWLSQIWCHVYVIHSKRWNPSCWRLHNLLSEQAELFHSVWGSFSSSCEFEGFVSCWIAFKDLCIAFKSWFLFCTPHTFILFFVCVYFFSILRARYDWIHRIHLYENISVASLPSVIKRFYLLFLMHFLQWIMSLMFRASHSEFFLSIAHRWIFVLNLF